MGSRRGLVAATAFFVVTAIAAPLLFRPLGPTGWAVLLASIAFVLLGCLALVKGDVPPRAPRVRSRSAPAPLADRADPDPADEPRIDLDAVVDEPTPEEREVLATTLAALQDVDVLQPDEVDVPLLWRAASASDPGRPMDVHAALASLAVLQEVGALVLRRLVFVPVHVEYDAALVAEITSALLTALGHDVAVRDVAVVIPSDHDDRASTVAFPLDGRTETVPFEFLVKDPPLDLVEALARRSRADAPRELVCAVVDQYLLYAAIPPGGLERLDRHFDALRRVPDEYAFSFDPA